MDLKHAPPIMDNSPALGSSSVRAPTIVDYPSSTHVPIEPTDLIRTYRVTRLQQDNSGQEFIIEPVETDPRNADEVLRLNPDL